MKISSKELYSKETYSNLDPASHPEAYIHPYLNGKYLLLILDFLCFFSLLNHRFNSLKHIPLFILIFTITYLYDGYNTKDQYQIFSLSSRCLFSSIFIIPLFIYINSLSVSTGLTYDESNIEAFNIIISFSLLSTLHRFFFSYFFLTKAEA